MRRFRPLQGCHVLQRSAQTAALQSSTIFTHWASRVYWACRILGCHLADQPESQIVTPAHTPESNPMVFSTTLPGLDFRLFRASVDMFQLTEGQVDGIASVNLLTGLSLTFFGAAGGAWITCYSTLLTSPPAASVARLEAIEISSGCLAIFFLACSVVGACSAWQQYRRIKRPASKRIPQ